MSHENIQSKLLPLGKLTPPPLRASFSVQLPSNDEGHSTPCIQSSSQSNTASFMQSPGFSSSSILNVRAMPLAHSENLKRSDSQLDLYILIQSKRIYWHQLDIVNHIYKACTAGLILSDEKVALSKALVFAHAAKELKPLAWYAYYFLAQIYLLLENNEAHLQAIHVVQKILLEQNDIDALLIIGDREQVLNLIDKRYSKVLLTIKEGEKSLGYKDGLPSCGFNTRATNAHAADFEVVQKLSYVDFDDTSERRDPRSRSNTSESTEREFNAVFAKACSHFTAALGGVRVNSKIDELQSLLRITNQKVDTHARALDNLRVDVSNMEDYIERLPGLIEGYSGNIESFLLALHNPSFLRPEIIDYSKALVLTICQSYSSALIVLADQVSLNTDNILKTIASGLFSMIPFCGSTLSTIAEKGVSVIQERVIRENAAKVIKLGSNAGEIYSLSIKILYMIISNEEKFSSITSEIADSTPTQSLFTKIKGVCKSIKGGDIYESYAAHLGYKDACKSIEGMIAFCTTDTQYTKSICLPNRIVIKCLIEAILPPSICMHNEFNKGGCESLVDISQDHNPAEVVDEDFNITGATDIRMTDV